MSKLPDLSLPDETRGKFQIPLDLKPMLYQGGAAVNLKKVNALIDAGQLGEPVMARLGLIKKLHEVLKGKQARGSSKNTIVLEIKVFRVLLAWADTNGRPVDLESIRQTYLEWAEHLVQRVRVRKDLKQVTAYHSGNLVGTLLDTILDRSWPLLHSSRLERPKDCKTPLGVEADKQSLESTFRFGHMLQDICDHLTLDLLWGPLPVRIPLREGAELEEWSGLRAEAKLLSARRDTNTSRRREIIKRTEATRARYAADRTLRTRMPLANLRIEAEILMFIGQTGMNLTQAHQLKLRHFSYASYLDGYQIRDYKERRGGPILFEIFHVYKKHFERYLDWRRQVFPDETLLFPLVRHGRAEDTAPSFERIKSTCAKVGVLYMPPRSLRNTRVNWLLRRSRDPDLTAEMDQHAKQTLLSVYERPSLQVAISEVTRFWVSYDPALVHTVPVAPGVCNGEPEPTTGMPMNVAQPDCVQRTGCLWCTHHRDIDSKNYVWALACFCHLKVIELSRLRGGQEAIDGHPARHAVDRLLQKIRWFQSSNEVRRSWVHEATARVEEGNYHPDWVRLIEAMEGGARVSMNLSELNLGISTADWVTPASRSYRPPSWPPPKDWVVVEDRDGNVLSRYGDPDWNLSEWRGKSEKLNFGEGRSSKKSKLIDSENADLLRQVMVWRLWGPRPIKIARTAKEVFSRLRNLFQVCSNEGILASDLMRFPKVLDIVIKRMPVSRFNGLVSELHRLFEARDQLGFVIATTDGIKRIAAANPGQNHVQTPYIPPRIWSYQVTRLRECLDDFLAHRQQIKDCFNFCQDAYAQNYGSLAKAVAPQHSLSPRFRPFVNQGRKNPGGRTRRIFHGAFEQTAERFGIRALLERWVEPYLPYGFLIQQFSSYLALIQYTGLYYIANFTLQRIEEAGSLRADCLIFENDEVLGHATIICGETTKTQPDSDARWPTSPSVEVAVEALKVVAHLRMQCAAKRPIVKLGEKDLENPYLINRPYEPWGGSRVTRYGIRPQLLSYKGVVTKFPKLFDLKRMRITEEDLRIARMLTPNLQEDEFAVGLIWPLGAHQLRRTGAVNMFASCLLSDSTMQYLMKHHSRLMPLYYGRGHTKLLLNEEVEKVVISTMYEVMSMQVIATLGDRFVSPHGAEKKNEICVNLISGRDAKSLAQAARRGDVSFRENRLGACTSRTNCSYGGVESIARCAGGDGFKPCIDVLYDREKAASIASEMQKVELEMERCPVGSPRHNALLVEMKGMENFLNVVRD